MSRKIDILAIVRGHVRSLRDEASGRMNRADLFVFFGVPLSLAVVSGIVGFVLSEGLTALLVNFGAILTALLLSVLVLVYDQAIKVRDRASEDQRVSNASSPLLAVRRELLRQLYFNICYAIILAISLALVCFVHAAMARSPSRILPDPTELQSWREIATILTTSCALFVAANLILTVLMIVKRLHALLTAED